MDDDVEPSMEFSLLEASEIRRMKTQRLVNAGKSCSVSFSEDQLAAIAEDNGLQNQPLSEQSDPLRPRRNDALEDIKNSLSNHQLMSIREGDSEVEQMGHSISHRHSNRLPVTKHVRGRMLHLCRDKAKHRHFGLRKVIVSDLIDLKNEQYQRMKQQKIWFKPLYTVLRIANEEEQLYKVLEKAVDVSTHYQLYKEGEEEFVYYEDFIFDYTHVVAKWPWLRPGLHRPLLFILFYYLSAPIWFCEISPDHQICDDQPDESSPRWLSAMYFASTTLSTVGYGDLSVSKNNDWHVFYGAVFMIWSNFVLVLAFSSAVNQTFSSLQSFNDKLINKLLKESSEEDFLHKKLRRLRLAMLAQFTFQFFLVNLVGVLALRIHIWRHKNELEDHPEISWGWMTSIYWAVQTTTTIGYGDVVPGPDFRWFQLIYLIVSTFFAGNALRGFARLNETVDEVRRRTAWQSREVSKAMIEEMQADDHDDKIDQYEFTVASLLQLGRIDEDDVRLIMDKFRSLCDDEGFIRVHEVEQQREEVEEQDEYEKSHGRRGSLAHRSSAFFGHVRHLLGGSSGKSDDLDIYLDAEDP